MKNAYSLWRLNGKFLFMLCCLLGTSSIFGQSKLWTPTAAKSDKSAQDIMSQLPKIEGRNLFDLNVDQMILQTKVAQNEFADRSQPTSRITLPMPNGTFKAFRAWESSLMEAGLAQKYPEIQTYIIQAVDDPLVSGRLMVSPYESSAYFVDVKERYEVFVRKVYKGQDPTYVSYYGKDDPSHQEPFVCTHEEKPSQQPQQGEKKLTTIETGSELHLLTIAVTFPGDLSEKEGYVTVAEAMAGLVSFMAEINTVYERDLSMRFVLPEGQEKLMFVDSATDPFTGNSGVQTGYESQLVQQELIGAQNYDVGMILVTGGCCAIFGLACTDAKEYNFSRFRSLKTTAHEIGHQFTASHTWTACGPTNNGQFGTNEYGSGTSIMSYANICNVDNILPTYDVTYFGVYSRFQMINYASGLTCGKRLQTGNTAPTINVPNDGFYLPQDTPFELVGSGTDAENDEITYSWEQTNIRNQDFTAYVSIQVEPQPSDGDMPLQRIFNPTTNPTRIIPALPNILTNTPTIYERLPKYTRGMKYSLYARDNHPGTGGTIFKEVSFNIDGNAGPFRITSQDNCTSWVGGNSYTVNWDVANTTNANLNVQNVNILLSLDRGQTWEYTLAGNTPNDGFQSITVPSGLCSSGGRIRVEAVGNYFFDINNADLSIEDGSSVVETPSIVDLGSGASVEITPSVGDFGTGDYTVESWVRTSSTDLSILWSKRDVCNCANLWNILIIDGKLRYEAMENQGCGNFTAKTGNTAINDGQWHHVAVVRQGTTVRVYIDGTEDFNLTGSQNINNPAPFRIGASECPGSLNGDFTEFRLWNIARSQTDLMNNKDCRLDGTESGLQVYYPVMRTTCGACGTDPAVLDDKTANNHDGTLLNGPEIKVSLLDIEECPTCSNGNISITNQPSNQSTSNGGNATFSVGASGNNLSYQWAVSTDGGSNFAEIADANASSYTLTAKSVQNGYQYRCYIVNGCDVQTSNAATLNVSCAALSLSSLNGEASPCFDNYYTYYVDPNNDVVNWNWTVPSNWNVTYFDNMIFVQVGNGSGNITVTATDGCGNMDTKTLSVSTIFPSITSLSNQTVNEGQPATFQTSTNISGTTEYIWQQSTDEGQTFTTIPGATTNAYNIPNVPISLDGRRYRCVVRNDCQLDTTNAATLLVNCVNSVPYNEREIQGASALCGNATVRYRVDPIPGADSYQWSLPAGWSGSSTTHEIEVTANGTGGMVEVFASNACGNSAPSQLEVAANPGTCNGGVDFDGIDDYLTAQEDTIYISGNMTISFWLKPRHLQGTQSILFSGTEFEVKIEGGKIRYMHSIQNTGYDSRPIIVLPQAPEVGKWQHIAITRQTANREVNMYVDGVLAHTEQWGTQFPSTPDDNEDYPLTFGASATGLTAHYSGQLDEVKIWDDVRTAAEIQADQFCVPFGGEPNLLAYYGFEDGMPNGDNTSLFGFFNASFAYLDAIPWNFTLQGPSSNVVDATKSSAISGPSIICNPGSTIDFLLDLPGSPNVSWTLPAGWSGSSTSETISATTGSNGGLISAEANLGCGTVRLEKVVTIVPPDPAPPVLGGDGLNFTGTTNFLSVVTGAVSLTPSDPFTVEFWAKRSTNSSFDFVVSQGTGQPENTLYIGFGAGGFPFISFLNGDLRHQVNVGSESWYHWAFVYDPSIPAPNDNRFLYKDGVLVASDRNTTGTTVTNDMRIGVNRFNNADEFQGTLDEFRVWSVARTASEIADSRFCSMECEDHLELNLPFDDGVPNGDNSSISTIKDFSLNQHEVAMIGFGLSGANSNFTPGLDILLYEDADQDGFGGTALYSCGPGSFATNNLDSDDQNSLINPAAVDICGNGIDENGNGIVDENDLALAFDGGNDKVLFGTTLGNFGTGDFTVEARIKTTGTLDYVVSKRDVCGTANFWNFGVHPTGTLSAELFNGAGGPNGNIIGSTVVNDGQWHHIALRRENGLTKIYLDGVEDASATLTANLNNNAELNLGPNACGNGFGGEIDNLRIWDTALSEEWINDFKDAVLPASIPGLLASYDFNNPNASGGGDNQNETTLTDRTGSNDGTLVDFDLNGNNSNWLGNPGICESCNTETTRVLDFDGTDDYVSLGNIMPASYTKEAWINMSPNNGLSNNFISGGGNGLHAFWAPISSGYKVSAGHNGTWFTVQDPNPIPTGWVHYAVTYNAVSQEMKLYKNGVEVDAATSVPGFNNGNIAYIGTYGPGAHFRGKLDEVRIWDHVRTEAAIMASKDKQLSGLESGLVAYYSLNQGVPNGNNASRTILRDQSPSGNNGTLTNFSLNGNTSNWSGPGPGLEVCPKVCDGVNVVIDDTSVEKDYAAEQTISTMNSVVVSDESEYSGGQSVSLNENFEVQQGALFEANIEECQSLQGFTGGGPASADKSKEGKPKSSKGEVNAPVQNSQTIRPGKPLKE